MRVKISVIITTYNRRELLKKAIRSLIDQSFLEWEALIVDNNIREKVYDIVVNFNDKRLRYLNTSKNLGECGGRNYAIQNSLGELICYLDDDDLLPPNSLHSRYMFLKSKTNSGMIFGEFFRFKNEDEIDHLIPCRSLQLPASLSKKRFDHLLTKTNYSRKYAWFYLRQFNYIRAGTPLIRKAVFKKVGLFDDSLTLFGDYDMWLRIVEKTKIDFLKEIVYYYRIHKNSISHISDEAILRYNSSLLARKHPTLSNGLIRRLL